MTLSRRLGWRKLIVLLAALACAGTWATGQVHNLRDRGEVSKMMETTKTVCVGRLLIDVPARSVAGVRGVMISGFDIDTVEENAAAFWERIAAREADIMTHGMAEGPHHPGGMIEARDLHMPGMVGRTLVFGKTYSHAFESGRRVEDEWVSVESHAHLKGVSFSLSMKFADESDARTAEALLGRLRPLGEDEIPAIPGFCIGRAVFAEPLPPHKTEHIVFHLGLPEHPDIGFRLFGSPGGGAGPHLIERVARTDAEAGVNEWLRVTKLRSGKRNIHGFEGEESVERVRESNFTTGYSFIWEARGARDDPLQPLLSLEMVTGNAPRSGGRPVETSLREGAVVDLWDHISSRIRLRPSSPLPGSPRLPESSTPTSNVP